MDASTPVFPVSPHPHQLHQLHNWNQKTPYFLSEELSKLYAINMMISLKDHVIKDIDDYKHNSKQIIALLKKNDKIHYDIQYQATQINSHY